MELRLFKTLWGHTTGLDSAIAACHDFGYHGLEGPLPIAPRGRRVFRERLQDEGLSYIAEICTAGSYVPTPHSTVEDHIASFSQQAEAAVECAPLFLTVLGGRDAWTLAEHVQFLRRASSIADSLGVIVSFETHRSRSLHSPWVTRQILELLPDLRLTCDFSHWCCVCERLVMNEEPELLQDCAQRAQHVHARVGYAQGPQVPNPAAPEYEEDLQAHQAWWDLIWEHQRARGDEFSTMTPEFGPDGYLHTVPFTATPVADLLEVNHWMATKQRRRFEQRDAAVATAVH